MEVQGLEEKADVKADIRNKDTKWWTKHRDFILWSIALIVSIFLFMMSRDEKVPIYQINSTDLVTPSDKGVSNVKILYAEKQVPRVTSTNLYIWNAGKRTIDKTDIAATDPLRLVLPNGSTVLQAKVIKAYRTTVSPQVNISGRSVFLSFDFMDKGDGFAVQILHTASSNDSLILAGTFKGSRPLQMVNGGNSVYSGLTYIVSILELFCLIIAVSILLWSRAVFANSDKKLVDDLLVMCNSVTDTLNTVDHSNCAGTDSVHGEKNDESGDEWNKKDTKCPIRLLLDSLDIWRTHVYSQNKEALLKVRRFKTPMIMLCVIGIIIALVNVLNTYLQTAQSLPNILR